jgi:hypothetical protein
MFNKPLNEGNFYLEALFLPNPAKKAPVPIKNIPIS